MANKFDDPGMTAAAVAEVAVETAKAARKNIHFRRLFCVMCFDDLISHSPIDFLCKTLTFSFL